MTTASLDPAAMLTLKLSNPRADDFLDPAPPGTPLPENQKVEVTDLRSACVAYLRFGHQHHLRGYYGELFDNSGCLVGVFSLNGRLWSIDDWKTPGGTPLYEPSGDEWREARELPPETEEERASFAAQIAQIREDASWPKPEPLEIGQAVLLFATPAPQNALRATVLDMRMDAFEGSGIEYQTRSVKQTRWNHGEWVHARLPTRNVSVEISRQVLATLRAEFAAIPVGLTGKTLGQVLSEALTVDARSWKIDDYASYDREAKKLLDEMVEIATLAIARQ